MVKLHKNFKIFMHMHFIILLLFCIMRHLYHVFLVKYNVFYKKIFYASNCEVF